MILFSDIIQMFHLADDDRGPMFRVISPDRGGIGLTPINGDRLRDAATLDRLGDEAQGL
jgi:hypothetical protein